MLWPLLRSTSTVECRHSRPNIVRFMRSRADMYGKFCTVTPFLGLVHISYWIRKVENHLIYTRSILLGLR